MTEELNQRLLPICKILNTVHETHIKTPWTNVYETGVAVVVVLPYVEVVVPVVVVVVPVPDVLLVDVASLTVK